MADILPTTFSMHFREWKVWYSTQISLKFVHKDPINDKPNRRQAITWTIDDLIHRCIYASLGPDE